jgi:four helix bundle protein
MGVRRYQDLIAWQLGEAFGAEVYRLVLNNQEARRDLKYCSQILDAADGISSNIAEGFPRCSRGDFCRFLDYSISSLGETERRLIKGIARGYFPEESCVEARRFAKRAAVAIVNLKKSQRRDWRPPRPRRPALT